MKLRSAQCQAQRTSDPGVIQSTLLGMPEADDFCTQDLHHEGAEVFGSQNQNPDAPIGANNETHRPDTINFFRAHPLKRVTRARAAILPTIVEEAKISIEQIQSLPPVGTDVCCLVANHYSV